MDDFKNDINFNMCRHEGFCLICADMEKARRANKPDAFSSTNEERVRKAEYF